MKLRSQLLLAGAMTLLVPLVGWQSVKQLYVSLQQTRIDDQTLKVANMRLGLSESAQVTRWLKPALAPQSPDDWYAESARFPVFLDGYDDDWRDMLGPWYVYSSVIGFEGEPEFKVAKEPFTTGYESSVVDEPWTRMENRLSFRVAKRDDQLLMFIRVADNDLVYHRIPLLPRDPGEGEQPDRWQQLVNGDAVELAIEQPDGRIEHGLFRAMAPGPVVAITASDSNTALAGQTLSRWHGYWSRTNGGYQLEVSVPLPINAAVVGISVIDVDVDESAAVHRRWIGSASPRQMAYAQSNNTSAYLDAQVFHASSSIRPLLEGWVTTGVRARLFDARGWLVADVNKLYTTSVDDLDDDEASSFNGVLDALLLRVFSLMVADDLPLLPERRSASVSFSLGEERRVAVADDQPITSRYVTDENDRVLGTLASIGQLPRRGYLLLEANEEHATAYASSQVARLFSLLLLVSIFVGAGLLVFALVLSSRIRRLSHQAEKAISLDGRVSALASSDAKDEIGELSRNLSSLLSRSAQYTHYLEALASRLSHELRTPLSVVRTSLENLDVDTLDEQSLMLVQRAEGGAQRLGKIIKALVDSTRLEQSVKLEAREPVDLATWLTASADVYGQIHPSMTILVRPEELPSLTVLISPVLLQQAMDKLIDNAVSFSTGNTLVLQLAPDNTQAVPHAMLTVANQGPGIQDSAVDQLFDPLVSHREDTSDELHLGLGLYMVRLIAEGSGGEVFARNQDEWVVFGLSLPLT